MLWAGLAGAGRDRARTLVSEALSAKGLARRVHVATDAEAAFYDAFQDGPGILLIGGTGSIAWGRGESGALVRVGGWGQRIGDEGSGYAVGLSALRQVLHAHDGREPATAMSDAVVERCGASGAADLVEWVETAAKREVGALAPLVVAAAEAGDAAAIAILEGAVTALVGHVVAAVERTGPWQGPAPVVVWGGLLAEGGPLRSRVLRALERPGIHLREGRLDPPAGAARLALRGL
jgi:glucosamine kinase